MKYNPFFSFFYEVYCCQMNHSDVSAISDYGSKIKKTYHMLSNGSFARQATPPMVLTNCIYGWAETFP